MTETTRAAARRPQPDPDRIALLKALERKLVWLSSWTIHHANHVRKSDDGLKVGGHQASSASVATLMAALYFHVLRPEDRVAVKPHASPIFHAIQYLLGHQTREKLERFRALGGAQSYPSRTKDGDDVDFSTGSVGLGVAVTLFASLAQDYVRMHRLVDRAQPAGRMVAVMGDAELDEGNIYEAMLEGWKHDVRNLWWVIDYNRQSLDSVVIDKLFQKIQDFFDAVGWQVVILKYGKRLEEVFAWEGGEALRAWIDDCPNDLYSALTFKAGAAWREHLNHSLPDGPFRKRLFAEHDDDRLHALMTNLAGHDMEAVVEAFDAVDSDLPHCFIAYTVKGHGLPFAGHKDNHAGLMNPEQMDTLRRDMGIAEGEEWERFAGMDIDPAAVQDFLDSVPFNAQGRRRFTAETVPVPAALPAPDARGKAMATQEAFGRILNELGRGDSPLAERIVTTSPDVTVSTNLGPWVNQRGLFNRADRADVFKEEKVVSAQRWAFNRRGQHLELGIAESNLFLTLAAFGLSHSLFGARLLPIGTLYDPFIARGLDSLNYAAYQDARFIVVGTPSGITLAPEGGAHQSIGTPLIGMAQDGLAAFEPAFVDELAVILGWAFDYMQRDGTARGDSVWLRDAQGGSVYLRLTTRPIRQPDRAADEALRDGIIQGGYWLREPAPGAELAIVYSGAVAPEALAAWEQAAEDVPGAGLLAVTSADRLNAGWTAADRGRQSGRSDDPSWIETLLAPMAPDAALVTVHDAHPAALGWLGSVRGHRTQSLGVEHFGQTGTLDELYRTYRIDTDAILDAVAQALVDRARAG
jgi:pyruvate dehydrogenase E1 component